MLNFNAHEAHRRYEAGESLTQLAITYGVAKGETIKARILNVGIAIRVRRIAHNRLSIDVDQILELYRVSLSVKKIAKHFGCARSVIVRCLKENRITPRNRSEAMSLRMAQATPEERQNFSTAAHDAVRGHKQTMNHRRKIAASKQNIKYSSPTELALIEHFTELGIKVIPQKAIGIYNVDIALTCAPIAVEVFGGNWHSTGRHAARFRKRLDEIINAGWIPVVIWVTRSHPLRIGAAQYCIALAKKLRHNKSVRRCEHVIGG